MGNHLFTKQRGRQGYSGFRGVLAAMLLGALLFATGARAAGLSGTYTIDASGSGNYTTFKAALSDLNTYGVSGAVQFNVTASTYSEVVSVGSITGASATNTITFTGKGRGNTTISSSGTTVSVKAYTRFDQMTILSSSSGSNLVNASGSIGCSFTNCNLTMGTGGSSSFCIAASSSNSLTVYNCELYGGGYGIYSIGANASLTYGLLRFSHNRVVQQATAGIYIEFDYLDSVAYNTVDSSTGSSYNYSVFQVEANGFTFWGNKIYAGGFEEVFFEEQDAAPVSGHPTQSYTVNNWIVAQTGGGSISYALFDIPEFSPNYTVAFNTIVNFGATAVCVLEEAIDAPNFTFSNNLIWQNNSSTSYTLEMIIPGSTIQSMDGNSYNVGAGGGIAYENPSSSFSTYSVAGYFSAVSGSGWETHSTTTTSSPPFMSLSYPFDLHLSTTKAAPKGVAGLGIATDIDGKGRFPSPSAGACESLYGIVNNNTGVIGLISPVAACPGTVTVKVTLANLGLNAVSTGGTVAWTWNGTPQTSVNYTTKIPLYGSITLTLGTVTLTAGVSNILKAWPTITNSGPNAGGSLDTMTVTGILPALGAGTYTIDGSKAVSGTNFKTFATAVTALNAGVCGPVVFNVSAATYTEAINIGAVIGASSVNTVTFHGAGRTKTTLTNSGTPVKLSGSSYVGFNNMTISTSGSGAVHVINDGGSSHCKFISCNLIAPNYSTNSGYVINATGSYLNVTNCRLLGGQYSFYSGGRFDSLTHNRIINMGLAAIYAPSATGNDYEYNVVDSVAYSSPNYLVYTQTEAGGNYNGNYFYGRNSSGALVTISDPLFVIEPNEVSVNIPGTSNPMPWNFTNNVVQSQAGTYDLIEILFQKGLVNFSFNTIMDDKGSQAGIENIIEICPNNTTIWASNVFVMNNSGSYGYYMFTSQPGFVSGNPLWDGGDTLYDGNDIVVNNPTSNWGLAGNSAVASYASYKSWASSQGYERHGTNVTPPFLNTGATPLYLDTTKASPIGVYTGINTDITGKKRCALFPTAGAFEDPYGKASKKTKIFVPSTGVYPNSPATIYQSHVAGDPAIYTWYVQNSNYSTWKLLTTTVDLYYNGWTTGTNRLKLVTTACAGMDSDSVSITVVAPTAVPNTDFIAASNTIQQTTFDQFTDLSTNGPTKWSWTISPDSMTVGSQKVPTTNQYNGSPALNTTQNPSIQFLYPGYYKVCLTAYNGLGKGAANCKTNYINVVPATNLGTTPQTVTAPQGYIFDNGGPSANYTPIGSPYYESVLIQPCADSIYLTFSQFDTRCGTDFVKLFNGSKPTASAQLGLCNTNTGTNSLGPGLNGGPTNLGCASSCVPNVNRPDTFKAGKTMLLQMACYSGGAPGFAAYYWVKPSSDKKVVPAFTSSAGSLTVCAGQLVTWKNTTTIDPKDPPSFEWDLNGDITDGFECVGLCGTQGDKDQQWPYFLPGTVPVMLIAINCGGADTLVQDVTVISPPKPVAALSADILAPTLTDVVTFTSGTVQCVDDYKWVIVPSTGNTGSAANFINSTTATSASPQVQFPDTGYYDVTLTVDNASGTQINSLTKTKYIHVRQPYCQPSVVSLSSDIGINHVVFNTIDNFTTPQASSGYLNFTTNSNLTTNIAVGATYSLVVSRDPNSIFSAINRDAYIDWNEDGYFTGTGENVLKDSNSKSQTYTAKITVPTTAKIGATTMRIATNLYLYPNVPCGPNAFGQFQDYRVFVTPYNILPVITLKGVSTLQDTIVVEQGYPYTEPGDSASSYLYGTITNDIKVTSKEVTKGTPFNIIVPGTYVFSYNVTDASNNKAITKNRVVRVTPDKTGPVLKMATNKVSGNDTIFQEVTSVPANLKPSLKSYVISSIDLVDGFLTTDVAIDSSLVQTAVVGVYPVTYTSTDQSLNSSHATIIVKVIDTIRPVLTLIGVTPLTVDVYTPFVDPGVTISVPNGYLTATQLRRSLHVTSAVNDSALGSYKVTYSLKDTFGNVAKPVTRIVIVADRTAPVLTLIGPSHDSVPVNSTYYDRGYTVSDNFWTKAGGVKVSTSGTFVTTFHNPLNFANKLGGGRDSVFRSLGGDYKLTYTALDGSGNSSTATRFIEVYDNVAPQISLIGDIEVNVCRWFPYSDLGYTLSDNFNDTTYLLKNVTKHGSLLSQGTSQPDIDLYLYYTVTDQAGNTGKSEVRTIHVLPANYFACTSGIKPGLGLDKYINVFPNPSSGIFNVDANLPAEEHVRISVTNMLGQEMMVVHDGSLLNNNFRIDLSNQASGVYFLNFITNTQNLTKRIELSK